MPYRALIHIKSFTMFLMLVMLIPTLVILSLLVRRQVIRHEMMEQLELKSLATIVIKKAGIKWIKRGRELEVNGKMFDVKSVSCHRDVYVITGLWDEKEDALIQNIKNAEQSAGDSPVKLAVSKLFSVVVFFEIKDAWQHPVARPAPANYYSSQSDLFLSFSPSLTGPPPKA